MSDLFERIEDKLNLPKELAQGIGELAILLQSAGAHRSQTEEFLNLCKEYLSPLSEKEKQIANNSFIAKINNSATNPSEGPKSLELSDSKLKGKDFI